MKRSNRIRAGLALVALSPLTVAQRAELASPLLVEAVEASGALIVGLDPEMLASLHETESVRLTDVWFPDASGVELVTLELERVHVADPAALLIVDGVVVAHGAELERGLTMWRGTIADDAASSVYLSFGTEGAMGSMRRGDGRTAHLDPILARGAPVRSRRSRLHFADPLRPDSAFGGYECATLPAPNAAPRMPPGTGGPPQCENIRNCRVAVETDWQYYELFGDIGAASQYVVSLFGSVSSRYLASASTNILISRLTFYTNPFDPWLTQDTGGSSTNLLNEFRNAMSGSSYPPNSDLAAFLSGADLGGGVAYLDVLCDKQAGFSVSGNLSTQLQFPVPPVGWFTWDFVVVAHELGHNFGTVHTHEYCPPLDQCWTSACNPMQVFSQGTIMSYCHQGTGGMNNITTSFHPVVAATLLAKAQASCIPLVCPAFLTGTVFKDMNNNGYFDGNDIPKVGWIVTAAGPEGVFTAITDANGAYVFDSLPCGDYQVSAKSSPLAVGTWFKSLQVIGCTSFLLDFPLWGGPLSSVKVRKF